MVANFTYILLVLLRNTQNGFTVCKQMTFFANGPVDLGSIPGPVIPKTLKMVLDSSLFNTRQYKVCTEDKVEQSMERSSALPYTSVL